MVPRLKSRIWVEALLRGCQSHGKFGAVLYPGHDDAGAVYVVINHLNSMHSLLAPAPGAAYDDDGNRRFELRARDLDWLTLNEKIKSLRRHDPDCWFVEIEDRDGFAGLSPVMP